MLLDAKNKENQEETNKKNPDNLVHKYGHGEQMSEEEMDLFVKKLQERGKRGKYNRQVNH
jgi:hypothetical protein